MQIPSVSPNKQDRDIQYSVFICSNAMKLRVWREGDIQCFEYYNSDTMLHVGPKNSYTLGDQRLACQEEMKVLILAYKVVFQPKETSLISPWIQQNDII